MIWPTPFLCEALGPARRVIPSNSKAVLPLWGRRGSAEVLRKPFDPAFPHGNASDAPGKILSHRDSSSIALHAGQSKRGRNRGWTSPFDHALFDPSEYDIFPPIIGKLFGNCNP